MKDIGKKYDDSQPLEATKNDVFYPRITMDKSQLPSLDGKKVGDKIEITFEAEVVGIYQRESKSDKVDEVTLELKKAECEYEEDVKPSGKILEKIKEMIKD